MAKCDEGYLCEICQQDVASITESDLYLRYVIGRVDPETLHSTPERHIRCNPVLAQYIVHAEFQPVTISGDFAKSNLDPKFVADEENLVTRGWQRLQELKNSELPITEYPLPEALAKYRRD